MIWLQVLATAVFCGAVLTETFKSNKKKIPCDTCKHLLKKGGGVWKYYCGNPVLYSGEFDKPPEYCVNYESREDGEQ